MNTHSSFMRRAITLAKRGYGHVSPNPLVGAIIVKDASSTIIGSGWYNGEKHAEVIAIEQALARAPNTDVQSLFSDTTLYCTLEPCTGRWKGKKQPPCTKRIIEIGIPRVYIAHSDPNPNIAGRGIATLREAGIEVHVGYLEKECKKLNEIFIHNCIEKRPFILLKIAQSIDGKIASFDGQSKWITSIQSRKEVHRLRSIYDAVLVGIGTVLADNPRLTVRHVSGRHPLRMVLDSHLQTPLDSNIVQLARDGKSYIFFHNADSLKKKSLLQERGVHLIQIAQTPPSSHINKENSAGRGIDIASLVRWLYEHKVTSVLIEGGAGLYSAFTERALFDKLQIYMAPRIYGDGISAFSALNLGMSDTMLKNVTLRTIRGSNDFCIEGYTSAD